MPLPQDLAAFLDHLRFQAHSNHATRQ
jgi:hypothetical protein